MADSDELQKAREHVAMLERKQDIAKRRADLQRELDSLNAEEQQLGKPAQPQAPAKP
jgi:hypothetical protein